MEFRSKLISPDKDELLIGLISDTHIPSREPDLPKKIIDDFKQNNIDYLFHLGDFDKHDVYQKFKDIFGNEKVIAVQGNMDDRKLRKELPETIELELYGHKIFMTHGTGGPNIIIKRLNKNHDLKPYDIIIFGHVHRPYNELWRDGKLYLCPGTPTDKKFTDINSYGYLRISKEKIDPKIIQL
ncbi:MAG: YfcE family phosphodiesterase [Candidatus Lokiarchaeota archaeon]|nr:YfcE family phosphodiesterase [Candidatus Lokiarchaeota archaeon]MBD3340708.1 YfcE family phosphodiesterase [Candidatus Lokiarchaeota archaeon]